MRTLLHTLAALTLATVLSGCLSDNNDADRGDQAPPAAQQTHTPGSHVDAEDYVGPVQAVTAKRFDPEVKGKKEQTTCKKRYTSGVKKNQCKEWNYKVTGADDADHVLVLADGTEVDTDQATYDSYNLEDADTAADVFPRA